MNFLLSSIFKIPLSTPSGSNSFFISVLTTESKNSGKCWRLSRAAPGFLVAGAGPARAGAGGIPTPAGCPASAWGPGYPPGSNQEGGLDQNVLDVRVSGGGVWLCQTFYKNPLLGAELLRGWPAPQTAALSYCPGK